MRAKVTRYDAAQLATIARLQRPRAYYAGLESEQLRKKKDGTSGSSEREDSPKVIKLEGNGKYRRYGMCVF